MTKPSLLKVSECVECGICVERCPFDVEIVAKLQQAVGVFEASMR
jgi:predicted aldo/keto reductase-like oxidoreductase